MTGSGMRVKGEGFPEKIGDQYRWRVTVEGKVRVGPLSPSKSAARAAFIKKERERKAKEANLQKEEENQSFSIYVQNLNAAKEKRVAPTTADNWHNMLRAIEKDPIGAMRPSDLCPPPKTPPKGKKPLENPVLADWRDRQTVSSETTKRRLAFIMMRLRDGGFDPGFVNPPPKRARVRRPLVIEERKAMLEIIEKADPMMRLAMYLCWHMGLRRSEACGLKHEDKQGDGVLIQRAVTLTRSAVYVRDFTKTPRGRRWIPIPPSLRQIIGHGKGFVLGTEKTPMHPKTLSCNMRDILMNTELRAKVPYMGLHALRRTFGMILLESGTDLITAAELGGHDPKVLAEDYARSRPDLKLAAFQRAFGEPEAPEEKAS